MQLMVLASPHVAWQQSTLLHNVCKVKLRKTHCNSYRIYSFLISSDSNIYTSLKQEYRPITYCKVTTGLPLVCTGSQECVWSTCLCFSQCCILHVCVSASSSMYLYAPVCVCVCVSVFETILETRLSLHQNTSILDGNKGENQSLCQSTLTEFLIIWHGPSVCDQLPIRLSLNVFLIQSLQCSPKPWYPSSELSVCFHRAHEHLFHSCPLSSSVVAVFRFWLPSRPKTQYSN